MASCVAVAQLAELGAGRFDLGGEIRDLRRPQRHRIRQPSCGPPVAATAKRDGASLCRHHRGRACFCWRSWFNSIIQLLDERHHVRRIGIDIPDSHVYSLSSRLVGAAVLWLFDDEDMVRTSALTIALVELAWPYSCSCDSCRNRPPCSLRNTCRWIPALGISYHLAVDGISVLFVGLTAFLTVLIVIYSWDTVRHQVKLYMMALLALETTTMGVFVSLDLILFFVFWELMLIPSYFLIKLWGGGAERHYAALKYRALYAAWQRVHAGGHRAPGYQLSSSGPPCTIWTRRIRSICWNCCPFRFRLSQQILIFWLMFLGFAFKAPVFPFHTWLPDAFLEGPIGMAVVLAGLKLGTFGFIRFSIPLLPDASKNHDRRLCHHGAGLAAILYGASWL